MDSYIDLTLYSITLVIAYNNFYAFPMIILMLQFLDFPEHLNPHAFNTIQLFDKLPYCRFIQRIMNKIQVNITGRPSVILRQAPHNNPAFNCNIAV